MTSDLRKQLRDTDPIRIEPPLPVAEIDTMRRKIVAVAAARSHERSQQLLRVAIAIGLVCGLVPTMLFLIRGRPAGAPIASPQIGEQRQLQFTTPGGTRIIWVLNPNFHLGGTRK